MLFNRFFYSHTRSFKSHTTNCVCPNLSGNKQFLVERGFYEPIHKFVDVIRDTRCPHYEWFFVQLIGVRIRGLHETFVLKYVTSNVSKLYRSRSVTTCPCCLRLIVRPVRALKCTTLGDSSDNASSAKVHLIVAKNFVRVNAVTPHIVIAVDAIEADQLSLLPDMFRSYESS